MIYCSIDIETAGLSRDCSLLEFGAVIDNLAEPKPIKELPTFHTYILNNKIVGEPYALALHQKILSRIANKEKPYNYTNALDLEDCFANFLSNNGMKVVKNNNGTDSGFEINVAGKNYAMFDRDWLDAIFNNGIVKVHRRVIDPAILYYKLGEDKTLPSFSECLKRAKLDGEVAHTALEDAMLVCRLLRKHFYH